MKYLLVMLFLIFLSGCIDKSKWQITCDSGYKTPIATWANINDDGIIIYNLEGFVYRKMLPGEVCITKKYMP